MVVPKVLGEIGSPDNVMPSTFLSNRGHFADSASSPRLFELPAATVCGVTAPNLHILVLSTLAYGPPLRHHVPHLPFSQSQPIQFLSWEFIKYFGAIYFFSLRNFPFFPRSDVVLLPTCTSSPPRLSRCCY